jgi:hypothetical protein
MAANTPNPWDRPKVLSTRKPFHLKHPPNPDELHQAIGKALSQWGSVEHHLCDTFCHLFQGKGRYAAYKLYGTFPSTYSKIQAIRTAGEAFFSDEKEQWEYLDRVIKLAEHFLARRNDIAHGVIQPNADGTVSLAEPHYNVKNKSASKNGYEFEASHIAEYGMRFIDVANEIYQSWLLLFPPEIAVDLVGGPLLGTLLRPYVEPQRTRLRGILDNRKLQTPQHPASPE